MRLFWAFIEAWDVRGGCGEPYEKVAGGGDAGLLSIADESCQTLAWRIDQNTKYVVQTIWLTFLSHKASWVFMGDGITGLSIILSFLLSGIAWFCSYSSPRTFPLATENIVPSAGRAPRKLDRARTIKSTRMVTEPWSYWFYWLTLIDNRGAHFTSGRDKGWNLVKGGGCGGRIAYGYDRSGRCSYRL
jgi:hypothetical protein